MMRHIGKDVKKPNKQTALAIVRMLRDKYDDEDLDDLLMFFSERPKGKAKTAEQWVAQAAGKKDIRDAVNYVYVNSGMAYATNGHRAHRALTGLADGFYCPATMTTVNCEGLVFPDVERVIRRPAGVAVYNCIDRMSRVEFKPARGRVLVRLECAQGNGYIDEDYILQATNGDTRREFARFNDTWYGSSEFGDFVVKGLNG